ncbi:RNase H domain-containing protein [Trichonephila clavipes]|uniref:RNase H domain-containing protein n=1 Tax=Trichonephila clavipes TaxID=2585209 RepID=A0A8X6R2H3_TRICX|nr:RNase H domain-containing protein [Trichonephila clavipes]
MYCKQDQRAVGSLVVRASDRKAWIRCPMPPSIGDSTSRSILHLFQQLSNWHPIHLQWVPSHVGLLGNEVADDHLAKAATSNPEDPEDHMVLTSTEIYSRAKELICRTWVVPPVYLWCFQRHPGFAISFKGSRSCQTAFS